MRIAVLSAAVIALAGFLAGAGHVGNSSVAAAADGVFGSPTLVSPHSPAFGIWAVIYLGIFGYAVWQALPAQADSARLRYVRPLTVAAILLNATWLAVVLMGHVLLSVLVVAALFTVLVALTVRLAELCPETRTERVLVDGTFGLYLGWICLTVFANVAVWLSSMGVSAGATAWSVIVLTAAGAAGVALILLTGSRIAVAFGLIWALSWIAYGRMAGEAPNTASAIAAACAAFVVMGAGFLKVVPGHSYPRLRMWSAGRGGHDVASQR
ncbi:Putative integral membrane protein [Hoyosella subflava DQS3-9A1]|uniref:Putative integral membrane protein n=2 Tax=Hoyosella TaxID=697025 RepID=F6EHD4_HOYSD|nr:Putative integral membrane protein [Hoyosella subflava DQS3-9A1]